MHASQPISSYILFNTFSNALKHIYSIWQRHDQDQRFIFSGGCNEKKLQIKVTVSIWDFKLHSSRIILLEGWSSRSMEHRQINGCVKKFKLGYFSQRLTKQVRGEKMLITNPSRGWKIKLFFFSSECIISFFNNMVQWINLEILIEYIT